MSKSIKAAKCNRIVRTSIKQGKIELGKMFAKETKKNETLAKLIDLSEVQRLNLRLMELASFNNFNGPKVVRDLLNHCEAWKACVMDMAGEYKFPSLIKLRDMVADGFEGEESHWNVDT